MKLNKKLSKLAGIPYYDLTEELVCSLNKDTVWLARKIIHTKDDIGCVPLRCISSKDGLGKLIKEDLIKQGIWTPKESYDHYEQFLKDKSNGK